MLSFFGGPRVPLLTCDASAACAPSDLMLNETALELGLFWGGKK